MAFACPVTRYFGTKNTSALMGRTFLAVYDTEGACLPAADGRLPTQHTQGPGRAGEGSVHGSG